MIHTAIDRLRHASPAFWRGVCVCGIAFAVLWSLAAQARDATGKYAGSQYEEWFRSQHNSEGQWCCDKSDGHPYYGEWKPNEDGGVTVELDGKPHVIPRHMVLTGPNPTGHAVWWFLETAGGHVDYCFAPGTLS